MLDFLDPKKKRAYNIRLFAGFVLMAIGLILGTTVLALITAGYNIDHHTGKVIQNGLVFLNAQPQSATIYVNGVKYGTTNARLELPSGNYSFDLRRSGYHDWSTSLSLEGGSVEQLAYPFLFPTKPLVTNVESLSQEPVVATESPNQHWLLVSVPGQLGSFYVIDVTNPKTPITTISLPDGVMTSEAGTNSLEFVEWSTDNQHLLLKHTYDGGYEYIMLDMTTPANSFNVNSLFSSTSFSSVVLDNKQYSSLYLYDSTGGTLSVGDVGSGTVTPLLTNVISFDPYSSNEILYTTADPTNPSQVSVKLWYKAQTYPIRDLPVSSQYLLNIASYSGNSYVVVGSSNDNDVYVYMNPISELAGASTNQLPVPYTLLILSGMPENVSFSTSARFIEAQSGGNFAVYDIQQQTHYRYSTSLKLDEPTELANWMDGDRLALVSGGKLVIFDFDGTNMVNFTDANADFIPAFNSAYSAVYTLTPSTVSPGTFNVERTSLIANQTAAQL